MGALNSPFIKVITGMTTLELLEKYAGRLGATQIPANGEVSAKMYIGDNRDFVVNALSRTDPVIASTFVQTSSGVYTYTLTTEASVSGQSGTATITAIVTVVDGRVKLTSTLALSKYGINLLTLNMEVTPGDTVPESASMIFNTSAVIATYVGTVVWTISNLGYLMPSYTYQLAEEVAVNGGTARPEEIPALLGMNGAAPGVLKISQVTTNYGADVLEVVVTLISNTKQYPGQYPRNLIGKLRGNTLTDLVTQPFLKSVRFYPYMKGTGCHDLSRTKRIRHLFNIEEDLVIFYQRICDYMAVRYTLSSLIYGVWAERWLLEKYYEKFLIDLEVSEFAPLLPWFLPEGIYYGFEKYMRWDLDRKSN